MHVYPRKSNKVNIILLKIGKLKSIKQLAIVPDRTTASHSKPGHINMIKFIIKIELLYYIMNMLNCI